MKTNQHLSYIAIKHFLYPQTSIGISANTCLLCLHIAAVLLGPKPRLTDLAIAHLALTHILMLLTMGLLVSPDIWELQDTPGDFKCKVLVFLHKVMRGLSICSTCVLSVLQAITISPHDSWLANLKFKSANPILWLFLFLWVLNMSLSSNLLFCIIAIPNKTQPGLLSLTGHCSFLPTSYKHSGLFLTLMALRDVFFVGLTVLSSGYMIVLLYKHKQRSVSLHGSRLSSKASAGQRATHTILLLLSCFAALYCADLLISLLVSMTRTTDPILVCFHMLLANGHGTVSPFVLINGDTQIIKLCRPHGGTKVSC